MRPTILHVAIDYDNPHRGRPTRAIANFIDRLDFADNVVVSLRRSSHPEALRNRLELGPADPTRPHVRVASMTYFGLPGGLGLGASMRRVVRRVEAMLTIESVRPDVVHAHKLTFEGLTACDVALEHGAALFVSIRGEVEAKVLRLKPTYRRRYQRIVERTDQLYFVSAWFLAPMRRWLNWDAGRERLLPNEVKNENAVISTRPATRGLVAVLNLNDWKRKGLADLLDALVLLRGRGTPVMLDVIGSGAPGAQAVVEQLIAKRNLGASVRLVGRIDNATLLSTLGDYQALVLPSRNETFGMVYAEALFAGVPVIMNRQSGIDGYLEGLDVALYVEGGNPVDIADKVAEMVRDNLRFRAAITADAGEIFDRFSSTRVLAQYRADVEAALFSR